MLFGIECCKLPTVRHAFTNVRKDHSLHVRRGQIDGNIRFNEFLAKGLSFEIPNYSGAVRSEFDN